MEAHRRFGAFRISALDRLDDGDMFQLDQIGALVPLPRDQGQAWDDHAFHLGFQGVEGQQEHGIVSRRRHGAVESQIVIAARLGRPVGGDRLHGDPDLERVEPGPNLRRTKMQDLPLRRPLPHERACAAPRLDEPVGLQTGERLAHDRPRDPRQPAELVLRRQPGSLAPLRAGD